MGKGKKKKGHSPRSPAPSSPSSSPPLKDSKPISAASEPPSSSGNFTSGSASDAQITDLVAQQTRLDSDIESPALVTPRNASDAQVSESSSDLVAQQSESDSAKDSPVVATPQPASDAQIVHLPVNLVAQLNEEVSTQAATTGLVETSAVIAPVTADPVTKESPPEETKKDPPQTTKGTFINRSLPEKDNGKEVDTWCSRAKGKTFLKKKNDGFLLPSGEACVKIPNSVIEKNKRSWDCFVIGQFYTDPPSQGIIHNIVNGIWSKQYRDIVVSKMEGNAFLFRIPNISTRNRVITQMLWQIEGKTMFVAKWEPGFIPAKPELTSAPIWLELRKVPYQFFNEEALESIASLVGEPKYLHPATANKTNLEVAKVFTIIDPRKPLPEAVNAQFETGEICRVLVSSPWMPPVCEHCKEIGHSARGCGKVTKLCANCSSSAHTTPNCPQNKKQNKNGAGKKTRRGRSKSKTRSLSVAPKGPKEGDEKIYRAIENTNVGDINASKVFEVGGTSLSSQQPEKVSTVGTITRTSSAACSEVERDSSDTASSDSDAEEGQIMEYDPGPDRKLRNRHSGKNRARGKAPPNL